MKNFTRLIAYGILFLLRLFNAFGQTPCPGTPTVDYAGKTYNTVLIGDQCWLKENLDIGVTIRHPNSSLNNDTIEKYCYSNDSVNCTTYGGLYQWDEVMQYSVIPGAQGICPVGWHIPSLAEFGTFRTAVGEDGNALKAVDQGAGGGADGGIDPVHRNDRAGNDYCSMNKIT